MRYLTCAVLAVILFGFAPQMADAGKPGKGVGKGLGKGLGKSLGKSFGKGLSRKGGLSNVGRSLSRSRSLRSQGAAKRPADSPAPSAEPAGRHDPERPGWAWARERQRRNEQRKLDHRLNQAEKLRALAEKNGNERLAETADRMETKAQQRFERRMERIGEADPQLPLTDAPPFQPGDAQQQPGDASPPVVESPQLQPEPVAPEVQIAVEPPQTKTKKRGWRERFSSLWPWKRAH